MNNRLLSIMVVVLTVVFGGMSFASDAVAGGDDIREQGDSIRAAFEKNSRPGRLTMFGELSFSDALYFYNSIDGRRDLLTTVIATGERLNLFGLLVYLSGDKREIASDSLIVLTTKSAYVNITKAELAQYKQIVITRTKLTPKELEERIVSGEPFTAEQALAYGLADEIVD